MDRIADETVDTDPRILSARSNWFDRKWRHREWLMSKFNRQQFGDKLDIDQTLTVNPSEAREEAWKRAQQAEYTEYTEPDAD